MKRTYNRTARFAICAASAVLAASTANAQSELGTVGLDGLIGNRIVDSMLTKENRAKPGVTAEEAGKENAASEIISHDLNFLYNYNFGHYSKSGVITTNQDSSTLSFLLDTRSGFACQPSLKLSYATLSSLSGSSGIGRSVTLNAPVALEFLHYLEGWKYEPSTNKFNLLIGENLGWMYTDTTQISKKSAFSSTHADNLIYGGVASFSWRFIEGQKNVSIESLLANPDKPGDAVLTLTPNYQVGEKSAKYIPMETYTNTSQGIFSLNVRVDYEVCSNLVLTPSASWLRYVHEKVPAGQTAVYADWAEFGAQVVYRINGRLKLTAGYSYDAFNPVYFSHVVSVLLAYRF